MQLKNISMALVLAFTAGIFAAPDDAAAKRKGYGERYYDYADGKWKIWKGRKYVSNKSPIPRRKVRFKEKYAPWHYRSKNLGASLILRYGERPGHAVWYRSWPRWFHLER